MQKNMKHTLSLLAIMVLMACTYANSENSAADIKNEYESVIYGNQEVMISNLRVTKFRNGEDIPHAEDAKAWEKAGENKAPAWAYYNNDPSTADECGLLYNWYAVADVRGLAPEGWHIPSEDEWKKLGDFFAAEYPRNVSPVKSKSAWVKYDNGDNSSGFNAFPCGYRGKDGEYSQYGDATAWWSASKDRGGDRSLNSLFFSFSNVFHEYRVAQNNRSAGLSVRCMKD